MTETVYTKNDQVPDDILQYFRESGGYDHIAVDIETERKPARDWRSLMTPHTILDGPFEQKQELTFFGQEPRLTEIYVCEHYEFRIIERQNDAIIVQARHVISKRDRDAIYPYPSK